MVGLAACGGDDRDAVRERVERYIEDERQVMQRAAPDFERANEVYAAYAKGELEADGAAEQVAQAERAIRDARDGVLVLDPPAEARPMHEDLLRYLDLNVGLARDTSRLVTYEPAAVSALEPLERVNRRLEARLAGSDDSRAQARELERFAAGLRAIARDLRAVRAPTVLRPAHQEQLRRLDATAELAGRLQRALRSGDAAAVSPAAQALPRRGAGPRGPAAALEPRGGAVLAAPSGTDGGPGRGPAGADAPAALAGLRRAFRRRARGRAPGRSPSGRRARTGRR